MRIPTCLSLQLPDLSAALTAGLAVVYFTAAEYDIILVCGYLSHLQLLNILNRSELHLGLIIIMSRRQLCQGMKYFSSVASAPIKKVVNTFVGSPLSIGARVNLKKVYVVFIVW